MYRTITLTAFCLAASATGVTALAQGQDNDRVHFPIPCLERPLEDQLNLIQDPSFELAEMMDAWLPVRGFSPITIRSQEGPLTDEEGNLVINRFAEFRPGSAVVVPIGQDRTSTRFIIEFCAVVTQGQFVVRLDGNPAGGRRDLFEYPPSPGSMTGMATSDPFQADFSEFGVQNTVVVIEFRGQDPDARGYIDNIQIIPDPGAEEPTPTPSEEEPTPTPEPTPTLGPTVPPPPDVLAGTPTPTPTPGLTSRSVRVNVNPALIVVNPDDVVSRVGSTKQVEITLQVIGTNGMPIDVLAIDPDARVSFRIEQRGESQDVGTIQGFERAGATTPMDGQRRNLRDFVGGDKRYTLYFRPNKPYDGIVRITADVDFIGVAEGRRTRQELRGVTQLVMRVDPAASYINPTGGFDHRQNQRLGRMPGDRGFRPDLRTNLFFRERFDD